MTQEASLRLGIDSRGAQTGARTAVRSLDDIRAAARRATTEVDKSGNAMQNTGRKAQGLAGRLAALRAAFGGLRGLAAAVGFGLMAREIAAAFRATDEMNRSLRVLRGTSRLIGVEFGRMSADVEFAGEAFRMTNREANNLVVGVTRITQMAGRVGQTRDAMKGLLDLAAAQGIEAAEAVDLLTGAIRGSDEATEKLFGGAQPSELWKKYAQEVGLATDNLNSHQRAQAVLMRLMDDAKKVPDEHRKSMTGLVGKQRESTKALEDMRTAFGQAFEPARITVLEEMARAFNAIAGALRGVGGVVADMVRGLDRVQTFMEITTGNARNALDEDARRFDLAGGAKANPWRSQGIFSDGGEGLLIAGLTVTGTKPKKPPTAAQINAAKGDEFDAIIGSGRFGFGSRVPLARLAGASGVAPNPIAPTVDTWHKTAGEFPMQGSITPGKGPGLLSQLGGAFKAQIGGLAAQFGPLAVAAATLAPVFQGLRDALAPVLSTLAGPLRVVGQLLGTVIAPVLKLLAPPLTLLAQAASYVVEAFGWAVRAIGKFIDAILPGKQRGLINIGQDMMDGAKAARNSLEGLAEAADKTTNAVTDIAKVVNLALYRSRVGAGSTGSAGGAVGGYTGSEYVPDPKAPAPAGVQMNFAPGSVVNNAGDTPEDLARKMAKGAQILAAQGQTLWMPSVRVA